MAVAVTRNGDHVAAGGGESDIRILDAADSLEAWRRKGNDEVGAARFNPTGRLLAYGGSRCPARILLAEAGDPM